MPSFGRRLKQALKEAGLTQKEAARTVGVTEQAMSNYVSGRIPEARILYRLARLCGRPMEWFLADEENEVEPEAPFAAIGGRIGRAMVWVGLTETEVARSLGVSEAEVKAMLEGRQLELPAIPKLCCLLRVTPEWLLSGEGEGPPDWSDLAAAREEFLRILTRIIVAVAASPPEKLRQVATDELPAENLLPEDLDLDRFFACIEKLLRAQKSSFATSVHLPPERHRGRKRGGDDP
ncbi:DNA-binding XRE family transcriptional regulator [Thermodesulfitimonas autotrophica]|uniref:DNA-binding XRE family transcriptional regulator n=1 Tax=Thermodesulfitimonas autotrophica TaxID=1894989 RepID=A0A3N5ANY9_9THEO|nr:helix-turn-helix transcriptional regulator [Thermodesulfitimonas autotrophica]RPF46819.1 DNA-binding XRE family transcriptional regulator [Thermodesulfitimonas autotrophica]